MSGVASAFAELREVTNAEAAPNEERLLVPAGELLALEPPEVASHFEQALLPVGGQMILHGAKKSFKSFMALDVCASLAQGQPWCCFESTDEPIRVGIMQFEIPWAYLQQRVRVLAASAADRALFEENFQVWTPLARPRFRAGNTEDEDTVLRELTNAGCTAFLFDPIRRGVGAVDMNSEGEVRPILNFFERVQNEGITVIATHHDNKQGERHGGGDSIEMTGSGAFGGDADAIVSVALPKGFDLQNPARNLHFLLRNAPSPSPRSMQMSDTGAITYAMEPIGAEASAPDDTNSPAI